MGSVLVVFESRYGQTHKIAERVREALERRGLEAHALPVEVARHADLSGHTAFFILAPVYVGRHPKTTERFMRQHAALLSEKPSAFVSVSSSAASGRADVRESAVRVAAELVKETGMRPRMIVTVGGAIAYPRYGFFLRWIMRSIARKGGMPTDTSRFHELTDWQALEDVLATFVDAVLVSAAPAKRGPSPAGESGVFRRTATRVARVHS